MTSARENQMLMHDVMLRRAGLDRYLVKSVLTSFGVHAAAASACLIVWPLISVRMQAPEAGQASVSLVASFTKAAEQGASGAVEIEAVTSADDRGGLKSTLRKAEPV